MQPASPESEFTLDSLARACGAPLRHLQEAAPPIAITSLPPAALNLDSSVDRLLLTEKRHDACHLPFFGAHQLAESAPGLLAHAGGHLAWSLRLAGRSMPGNFRSPLMGLDACSKRQTSLSLPLQPDFEYGTLILEGEIRMGEEHFQTDEFAYLGLGTDSIRLELSARSRILLLGGVPFEAPVLMWWNFFGFGKDEIAEAQHAWETGAARFGRVEGDDGRRLLAPPLLWSGY